MAWITLPDDVDRRLDRPLKISRGGYASNGAAEGANAIAGTSEGGAPVIHLSSGHGFIGTDPRNLDCSLLGDLARAVEETARSYFPRHYEEARKQGMLSAPRRFCIRAVVGPPVRRAAEFLALVEAGVVCIPFGPSPRARRNSAGGWTISSTALASPVEAQVDAIITGHIETPSVDRSESSLLRQLWDDGRICPAAGKLGASGIDVDADGRPRNSRGLIEESIFVLGPLTEGSRYFTHYVPSPKSRSRAFVDASNATRLILDRVATNHDAALLDPAEL